MDVLLPGFPPLMAIVHWPIRGIIAGAWPSKQKLVQTAGRNRERHSLLGGKAGTVRGVPPSSDQRVGASCPDRASIYRTALGSWGGQFADLPVGIAMTRQADYD